MSDEGIDIERCAAEGPETALERQLVTDFLRDKGYRMEDLHKLPAEQVAALMKEACQYASLKLADIEAKSIFRKTISPSV
jgi:hypothetical protein